MILEHCVMATQLYWLAYVTFVYMSVNWLVYLPPVLVSADCSFGPLIHLYAGMPVFPPPPNP